MIGELLLEQLLNVLVGLGISRLPSFFQEGLEGEHDGELDLGAVGDAGFDLGCVDLIRINRAESFEWRPVRDLVFRSRYVIVAFLAWQEHWLRSAVLLSILVEKFLLLAIFLFKQFLIGRLVLVSFLLLQREVSFSHYLLQAALEQEATGREHDGLVDSEHHEIAILRQHLRSRLPVLLRHEVRRLQQLLVEQEEQDPRQELLPEQAKHLAIFSNDLPQGFNIDFVHFSHHGVVREQNHLGLVREHWQDVLEPDDFAG